MPDFFLSIRFLEIQETKILEVVSDFIMKLGAIHPVRDNAAGLRTKQSETASLSANSGNSAPWLQFE